MICNDEEIREIFYECTSDLEDMGYEVPYDQITVIEWNGRLSRCVGRCTTRTMVVGGTHKRPVWHKIQLNKCLEKCSYESKKNILMHEIIHTLYPYDNHGNYFKSVMNTVNSYGYNVEIRNTNAEVNQHNKKKTMRYKLTCKECGTVVYRSRKPSCTMIHSRDKGEMIVEKIA